MKRLIPFALAAALLGGCASPPIHLGEDDDHLACPEDLAGVCNFARIDGGVWRGAQPTAEGMRTLKTLGVRTVVNLRSMHSDRDELRGTGLDYAHFAANAFFIDEEEVVPFLRLATDPARQPVFVHCQHGADRTGMCIAAYRVVVQGWPKDRAMRELRNFGFHGIYTNIEKWIDRMDVEKIRKMLADADVVVDTVR